MNNDLIDVIDDEDYDQVNKITKDPKIFSIMA
jgi:hypothetical protein